MQSPPPRYDPPKPDLMRPVRPRIRKSKAELMIDVLTSVQFWGGLSVLVALASLALPWWGVTIEPATFKSSWGLFFGPQSQQANVVFFQDRLDAAFAVNYSFMTALVLLTALFTALAAAMRRPFALIISLTLAVITVMSFFWDVTYALAGDCAQTLVEGGSCISGLVGQGTSGLNIVTWGFESGFYTFVASTILLLGALALQANKSRNI